MLGSSVRTRAVWFAGAYLVVAGVAAIRVVAPHTGLAGVYALVATAPWGVLGIFVIDRFAPELAGSFLVNLALTIGSIGLNTLFIYALVTRTAARSDGAPASRKPIDTG